MTVLVRDKDQAPNTAYSIPLDDWSFVSYSKHNEEEQYSDPMVLTWDSARFPSAQSFTIRLHTLKKLWADRVWPASTHLAELFLDPEFLVEGLEVII